MQCIIKNELKCRKKSVRWIPCILNTIQKSGQAEICQRLLTLYEAENCAFLLNILTCDETWVHNYTPEPNQSSMEWCSQNETIPINEKARLSAGKVLTSVFWDYRGIIYIDFLLDQTINVAYCCRLLGKVKATYWSKRYDALIYSVLHLSDNASPHTDMITLKWNCGRSTGPQLKIIRTVPICHQVTTICLNLSKNLSLIHI